MTKEQKVIIRLSDGKDHFGNLKHHASDFLKAEELYKILESKLGKTYTKAEAAVFFANKYYEDNIKKINLDDIKKYVASKPFLADSLQKI